MSAGTNSGHAPGGRGRRRGGLVAACVAASLMLASCGDETPAARYDPNACAQWSALQGFSLRWERFNHRVSKLAIGMTPVDACGADSVAATFVGGDWTTGDVATDTPTVEVSATRVHATREQLGVFRTVVDVAVDASGAATRTVTVDRREAHLLGYPALTATIDGLALDTDVPQDEGYPADYSPALGYTTRGAGVRVEVVDLGPDAATLRVDVRYEHGASDREDMNRALQVARSRVAVGVAIVGTAAPAVRADVSYQLSYPRQRAGVDPEHARATGAQTAVAIAAPRRTSERGTAAFTAIDWTLTAPVTCTPQERCPTGDTCVDGECAGVYGPAGFYLRELGATVGVQSATPDGVALTVDGFASNASRAIAYFALTHDFSAQVAWFDVDAAAPVSVGGAFETGEATFTLAPAAPEAP